MPIYGDEFPVQAPRVVAPSHRFVEAAADAGVPMLLAVSYGEHTYPGFLGTASTLARFMESARVVFGPSDTAMLGAIVRARTTDHDDDHNARLHFYFPGLELY